MNSLLFVYGSLLSAQNEFARYLNQHSEVLTNATFKGRLYDMGEYPGAILDDAGYPVKGIICNILNPDETLKVLDEYEGFGEMEEQPNLFIRKIIEADTQGGPMSCWVYLYNHSLTGATEIITGNYQSYLK